MDAISQTPLQTWHFFLFLAILAALGVIGHFTRALINPVPDRLTNSDTFDMVFSDGFSLHDYLFGTEYDEYGYYRLDSWKNFRLSIITSMTAGAIVYLFIEPEMAHAFAYYANTAAEWIWNMTIGRL